jgi:hypothetical protein
MTLNEYTTMMHRMVEAFRERDDEPISVPYGARGHRPFQKSS